MIATTSGFVIVKLEVVAIVFVCFFLCSMGNAVEIGARFPELLGGEFGEPGEFKQDSAPLQSSTILGTAVLHFPIPANIYSKPLSQGLTRLGMVSLIQSIAWCQMVIPFNTLG